MSSATMQEFDPAAAKPGVARRVNARTLARLLRAPSCRQTVTINMRFSVRPADTRPRKIVEPARRRDGQKPRLSRFGQPAALSAAIGSHPPAVPLNIFRIACASR